VDRVLDEEGGVTFQMKMKNPGRARRKETPPMLKVIRDSDDRDPTTQVPTLDELARQGAYRMLMQALEEEVQAYLDRHPERDEDGKRLVVRNGKGQGRTITCGAGTFEVKAPRVNDKRVDESGDRKRFMSRILPPYMRRSPKVAEVLPILYLRGLSTGDFKEALPVLLGEDAAGLSATNIARLTSVWEQEYREFRTRSLEGMNYVYVWADGIHFRVRLEDDRLCTLVLIGVKADGTKDLIAIQDGYRESTESWKEVLRELKTRGMNAPALAIGDGALGFWGALADVFPQTLEQRDWCHKIANVLDKLPKRSQPKAKQMLRDIMYADTREQAEEFIEVFKKKFGAKHERAIQCLTKDQDALLRFFDFPAEHWKHLRTSNVVESPFATVRLRQKVTKGAGNRNKALTMAFKLLLMAQGRWRRLSAPHLLPLVAAGVRFVDGIQQHIKDEESRRDAA
jgi:putative transposase